MLAFCTQVIVRRDSLWAGAVGMLNEHSRFGLTLHAMVNLPKLFAGGHGFWAPGYPITVSFLNGSPTVQASVRSIASQWSAKTKVKLVFVDGDFADIRIEFGSANLSSVGTAARDVPYGKPTMTLVTGLAGEEFRGIVLHEFGHVLGLVHEHQTPAATQIIQWKEEKVYDYYLRNHGWSAPMVESQVLNYYKLDRTQYTAFDTASIMIYSIPEGLTHDGLMVRQTTQLSRTDIDFVTKMYRWPL
jgi:hypothetical protein